MTDDELQDIYDEYGNRMSDLSYILVRFYWDLIECGSKGRNNTMVRKIYNVYKSLLNEYDELCRCVEKMDERWDEFYKISYDKSFDYDFIDLYSPGIQLKFIRNQLINFIPVIIFQKLYKKRYKKRLNSIKKIQRNWKVCRYNPEYKMCWIVQERLLKEI